MLGYRITPIPESSINPENDVIWRRRTECVISSNIQPGEDLYDEILIYSYEDPFPKALATLQRIRISDAPRKVLTEYLPYVNLKEFINKLRQSGLLIGQKCGGDRELSSIVGKLIQALNLQRQSFILYVCSTRKSIRRVGAVQKLIQKILCDRLGDNLIHIECIYKRFP